MIIPSDIDFESFASFIGKQESQEIHPADYWRDDLQELMANGDATTGSVLPWRITENRLQIRGGEVTIWCGDNGHLKSMAIGQAFLGLAKTERVAIASMEMRPTTTLSRMCRQAAGNSNPAPEYVDKFMDWSHDRMFIYNQLDHVPMARILGMVWYAAKELGCKHILIDSFMMCGVAMDGNGSLTAQTDFMSRLCWCAKTLNCHIHLVAHFRKRLDRTQIGSRYDIFGASQISNLAFNVVICWKNEIRESARNKIRNHQDLDDEESFHLENHKDFILKVDKQRNDKFLGKLGFWLHEPSLQLVTQRDARPEIMNL